MDTILGVLMEKLGENKIQAELAETCLMELARCPIVTCSAVSQVLIKTAIKGKLSSGK